MWLSLADSSASKASVEDALTMPTLINLVFLNTAAPWPFSHQSLDFSPSEHAAVPLAQHPRLDIA